MTLTINPSNDAETQRQKRNLTQSQSKTLGDTKQGVVVNSLIKPTSSDENVYDSMIISQNTPLPDKLYEDKSSGVKNIYPIALTAVGTMASIAALSLLVKHSIKVKSGLKEFEKIHDFPRNHSVNKETDQAIFRMIQCPTQKTILAGTGVLAISVMGFMGKMFIDGFKEIWVKKQEANIQKNLQENLIAVETQSFSGKIQIIRSMLSEKAKEFDSYLNPKPSKEVAFGKNDKDASIENNKTDKSSNLKFFALGVLTIGAIVGLGFLSIKSLTKGKGELEKWIKTRKNDFSEIIKTSNAGSKEADKKIIQEIITSIDEKPEYVKGELAKLDWGKELEKEKDSFVEQTLYNLKKATSIADKAFAGEGGFKPTFYSHVDDYRAFLYDYLLNSSNPLFRNLFLGITGATAMGYAGKVLGEGVKEVQVKKTNAETELGLQKRLVATELRNFKAKKDAAINPLCEEFYVQVKRGKPDMELKTIAENIIFEVKNGPPYVYS